MNKIISLIYAEHMIEDGSFFYDTLPIGMYMWNEFVTYNTLTPKKHLMITTIANKIDDFLWRKIAINYENHNIPQSKVREKPRFS